MRLATLACCMLLLTLAVNLPARPALAQQPLRWKLAEGDKFSLRTVQEEKMTIGGSSMGEVSSDSTHELYFTWEVKSVNETDDAVIAQTFNRIKFTISTSMLTLEYDTAAEKQPVGLEAMIAPLFDALIGKEARLTLSPLGEVSNVELPEIAAGQLAQNPGLMALGELASPERFQEIVMQAFITLPDVMPAEGESWTTETESVDQLFGKQMIAMTMLYEGTEEVDGHEYAKINPSIEITHGSDTVRVREEQSSGEVLFDLDAGRITTSEIDFFHNRRKTIGDLVLRNTIDQTTRLDIVPFGEPLPEIPKVEEQVTEKQPDVEPADQ